MDFFVEDLWQKLPKSWREVLDDISLEEFGKWILGESNISRIWPLSLLSLRQTINLLQINRDHDRNESIDCKVRKKETLENTESDGNRIDDSISEGTFFRRVKKKKIYEIERISDIASQCATVTNCWNIVDLGAGMGHLARSLAFKKGLRVVCIEQNEDLSLLAKKCDDQLFNIIQNRIPKLMTCSKPTHIKLKLDFCENSLKELTKELTNTFKNNRSEDIEPGFGLIGLHPCGDLAASLLRWYSLESQARSICIVGCCYMKLTHNYEKDVDSKCGYPLSLHVKGQKSPELTYSALEVACHAIENHCEKLKTGNYNELKVHAFRAVLECLLLELAPQFKHAHLKSVKMKKEMTFKEYSRALTEGIITLKDETNFEKSELTEKLAQWKRVIIFASLRLMIAPLIESLVLYDRFLYLSEQNLTPCLRAVFDSKISPRNLILISKKSSHSLLE